MSSPWFGWPHPNAWMSAAEWGATGANHHGPETDYGLRWGTQQNIRVSYSPSTVPGQADTGRLYAYDPSGDRYAVLAPSVSADRVADAWHKLTAHESLVGADLSDWPKMLAHTPPAPSADPILVHYLVLHSSDRGARTVARKLSAADVDGALDEMARLRQSVTEDGGWLRVTSISQGEHSVPVTRRDIAAPVHIEYATVARSTEVEL